MVKGDVCGYIIYSPWEMVDGDKMHIKIYNMKNADVYLAKGKSLRWFNHLDQMAVDGNTYDTRAGWQFYVVGVANSMFAGTFTMKIWVEKKPEEEKVPDPPKPVDPPPKPDTDTDKNTDTNTNTNTDSSNNSGNSNTNTNTDNKNDNSNSNSNTTP